MLRVRLWSSSTMWYHLIGNIEASVGVELEYGTFPAVSKAGMSSACACLCSSVFE
jgi:hypothetical protein